MRQYARGLPWARQFRADAALVSKLHELRELIEEYVASLDDPDRPLAECEFFEETV